MYSFDNNFFQIAKIKESCRNHPNSQGYGWKAKGLIFKILANDVHIKTPVNIYKLIWKKEFLGVDDYHNDG